MKIEICKLLCKGICVNILSLRRKFATQKRIIFHFFVLFHLQTDLFQCRVFHTRIIAPLQCNKDLLWSEFIASFFLHKQIYITAEGERKKVINSQTLPSCERFEACDNNLELIKCSLAHKVFRPLRLSNLNHNVWGLSIDLILMCVRLRKCKNFNKCERAL